jgi:hypothetical protein
MTELLLAFPIRHTSLEGTVDILISGKPKAICMWSSRFSPVAMGLWRRQLLNQGRARHGLVAAV